MNQHKAILLIGPTGSGKTPLGSLFEEKGLWGRRCLHFDFGEALREIAETGMGPSPLTDEDIDVINQSLKSGALLEDENFHVAGNILMSFVKDKGMGRNDFVLLNGMPRHPGQAGDIDGIIDVKMILYLECSSAVVRERIQLNSGGDRNGRIDDSPGAVEKKLRLFQERTFPLLNHYSEKGIGIEKIDVESDTTPEEIHRLLDAKDIKTYPRKEVKRFK